MKKWFARFVLVAGYGSFPFLIPLLFDKYTYWIEVGIAFAIIITVSLYLAVMGWAVVNAK